MLFWWSVQIVLTSFIYHTVTNLVRTVLLRYFSCLFLGYTMSVIQRRKKKENKMWSKWWCRKWLSCFELTKTAGQKAWRLIRCTDVKLLQITGRITKAAQLFEWLLQMEISTVQMPSLVFLANLWSQSTLPPTHALSYADVFQSILILHSTWPLYISSCVLRTRNVTSFSCFQAQFEFALTAVAEEVNAILQALAKWFLPAKQKGLYQHPRDFNLVTCEWTKWFFKFCW